MASIRQLRYAATVVFDRAAKLAQRSRLVRRDDFKQYELLKDEVAYRVADRVYDIKRNFAKGLDVGCGRGHLGKVLDTEAVTKFVQLDASQELLNHFDAGSRDLDARVCADEETLPFEDGTFDLAVSSLSLHWVNDLPKALREIRRVLRPDAPFVAAMFGQDTLSELRTSLQLAELERRGGLSPRISPFVEMRDVGGLLNQAGFQLITVDVDEIVFAFPSITELLVDLRGMGESNADLRRAAHLPRETLAAASAIYQTLYGNPDGTIPATFRIFYMMGWSPDPSQPKAAKRGSADASLKELAEELEKTTGEH